MAYTSNYQQEMNNQLHEIKCPNCGTVFSIDEASYAAIVKQVRDEEFRKDLASREKEIIEKKEAEFKLSQKEIELNHSQNISAIQSDLEKKDLKIQELQSKLDAADTEMELKISQAVQEKDKKLAEKDIEILQLEKDLESQKNNGESEKNNLIEKYSNEIKLREEEIERLKDFKARQSTKMVGESLEQHCMAQFNQIRMTAFPNAYFEKDNDSRFGSKGDFIFRESSDGVEFISIMFEMKNEMDTTATKHRNEDFFKELDKDRNQKKCEYAVLVSLLESDNELYNNGIVDVSYRYPKMFVVRPQFFIPIISLLRNAALNSLEYRKKLEIIQNQQLDIYNFEANLADFKDKFQRNFNLASDRFNDAIDGIDKAIKNLETIKKNLIKSNDHLKAANNKLEDVTIKRLTNNAPSVRAMFEEKKQ